LSHSTNLFYVLGIFDVQSCKLLAWSDFLLSASQVARVTGMSHQCPAFMMF
jgi:hypothetical protein